MKKVLLYAMVLMGLFTAQVSAQTEKELKKERKELLKESRKALKQKASKDARKQAKQLRKEGWTEGAGSLSLEKQIDQSLLNQVEVNAYGKKSHLMGQSNSIGETIDAARFSAMEMAKVNLVQSMAQEIAGGVEDALGNKQLSAEDAASIMESTGRFRTIVQHKLTGLDPVVSIYRKLPNKNTECRVVLFYPRAEMENVMKQAIREQLLKDGKRTQEEIDCLINGYCKIEQ